MTVRKVTISIGENETIPGMLSLPDDSVKGPLTCVAIAHGAANDMENPLIHYLADGLAGEGFATLRFNFSYRERGQKAPDSQKKLVHAWGCVFRFLMEESGLRPDRFVAAGKSMGGRVASQMVAEGSLPADRLVFLGYPLHPPGKKEQLRDAHLYEIPVPMLFFAGTRDTLCDLAELKGVLGKLDASWDLEVIEGGDHSFHLPKSAETEETEVYERILNRTANWLCH
jgi:predicted alpha/beta-hydrolase family hydrolase